MRKYTLILFAFLTPLFISAQDLTGGSVYSNPDLNTGMNTTGMFNTGTTIPGLMNPLNVNLQTGASFGSLGYGGNFFQSFVSPAVGMPLNKKLSVSAGVTYSHTNYNNMPLLKNTGEFENYSGSLNSLTMHASGIYRANDKVTFTGSAFRTVNPSFNSRLNPEALQMEAKGFSFGVDYKLGENTHIGAEIRYQQGNSNFLTPYDNFYSPYRHNSPFINNYGFPSGY